MRLFKLFKNLVRKPQALPGDKVSSFESLEGRAMMSATPSLVVPTNLNAVPTSSTAMKLNWSDNSSSEAGYKIERSSDGTTFGLLNTVGKNVATYTTGKLTTGKKYYFRVRAFN